MALKIGVIAEEQNDIDVLYRLTCKILPESHFSFRRFIGGGCGRLRKKCGAWARNLIRRGCTHLVVMHDRDARDEGALRRDLEARVGPLGFQGHVILIPVEELEAWLLCDADALRRVFGMSDVPKVPARPDLLTKPKEYLRDMVWRMSKRRYVNTIHNAKIAHEMSLTSLGACASFGRYPRFVRRVDPG